MTATYNITINKGETFTRTFTWKDSNGDVIDLTGYTARMQIREELEDTSVIVDLTTGSGITLGGVAGTVKIVIDATTTAAISSGSGVYDIELVNGAEVTRFLEGSVEFNGNVTR